MPDVHEEISNIKLSMKLLEKDIELNGKLCAKVSESIEKIQEVNSNLMKMISLHEQKHDNHDIVERDLKSDVKEIHSRITTVNRVMMDKLEQTEKNLSDKIDMLRKELLDRENIEEKKSVEQPFNAKYIWMFLGAIVTITWVVSNVNLTALAALFK